MREKVFLQSHEGLFFKKKKKIFLYFSLDV